MAAGRQLAFPEDVRYAAETHEWARHDGAICTVGISDYAQHEIGDVVYVELPEVGTAVEAGREFGVIESVKAAFDLYAPMSGDVTEINRVLETRPELVNEDPYGEGWMIRIRASAPDELDVLLDAAAYRRAVEEG
jgi:glycine cleavage system H protein